MNIHVLDVYLALALQLVIQLVIFAFWQGRIGQKISDLEGRVARIESIFDNFLSRLSHAQFREPLSKLDVK